MNNIVTSSLLNNIVEATVNNIVKTMLNDIVETMLNDIVETMLNDIVGPTMLFKHCSGNNPVTTCEIFTCSTGTGILLANHYEFNPLPPGLQQQVKSINCTASFIFPSVTYFSTAVGKTFRLFFRINLIIKILVIRKECRLEISVAALNEKLK